MKDGETTGIESKEDTILELSERVDEEECPHGEFSDILKGEASCKSFCGPQRSEEGQK